jgi:hypothetical protein
MLAATGVLALSGSASAYSGPFAVFNDCPVTSPEIAYCLHAVTTSGSVVLGKQTTPIVNPVTLQGGYSFNEETEAEKFIGAKDGNTLTKAAQPVPGGLLGILPPEFLPEPLKKLFEEYIINKGPTGVYATLELAKPASAIQINAANIINEEGVSLQLPVKIHLENSFLGSKCYIGSESSPLIWNLTTGTTHPPAPNKSITGSSGIAGLEEGAIATLTGTKLVDNSFSAPGASGCGGFLIELLEDPVINSKLGIPATGGNNTVILNDNIQQAFYKQVLKHP